MFLTRLAPICSGECAGDEKDSLRMTEVPFRRGPYKAFAAAKTSAAWSLTFTLRQTCATLPSLPIR